MSRTWKLLTFLLTALLLLTACGKPVEERATDGLKKAEDVFYQKPMAQNDEIDGVKLYKPTGFKIEGNSDAQNIVLNKGKQPFILFINPNEAKDSQLFYDLLQADEQQDIIAEEKFGDGDTFGFVAVIQNKDDTVELIANVGGAKITTQAKEKNIANNLETMMQVVRSID